jgi:hypothetical protein
LHQCDGTSIIQNDERSKETIHGNSHRNISELRRMNLR